MNMRVTARNNLRHKACLTTRLSARSEGGCIQSPNARLSVSSQRKAVRVYATDEGLRVRTPHSGYHDDGSGRKFFEGWYFKVTLPDLGESFAMMYSVEKGTTPERVGVQVMGPGDGYIAQSNTDISTFWADRNALNLGACFKPAEARKFGDVPKRGMDQLTFNDTVEQGFQASDDWHQGYIVDAPGTAPGSLPASVPSVRWAFRIRPMYGWGDAGRMQKSTAGWMSSLPVFEPHWQVLMAHGLADGWVQWGEEIFTFSNAPAYAEKNWGDGFPNKWAWLQCNSFPKYPNLSITAVGAVRNLLNVPGITEDVGMIGMHYQGRFIELTPWAGPEADVRWSIEPWGAWRIWSRNAKFEAVIEVRADENAGTILRAPTATEGLAPIAKDTFYGHARLRLWQLDAMGVRNGEPLVDALSDSCAAEVGGGPWWYTWSKQAKLSPGVKLAIGLPVDQSISQFGSLIDSTGLKLRLPSSLWPPGM